MRHIQTALATDFQLIPNRTSAVSRHFLYLPIQILLVPFGRFLKFINIFKKMKNLSPTSFQENLKGRFLPI